MKLLLRFILALGLIFLALKLLIPYNLYPIEHFEYKLAHILPFSWKAIAIMSRVLIGFLFVGAFLALFYWEKTKWTKYLAPFMIALPFIINAIFPENFKDEPQTLNEELPFKLKAENNNEVLIAYFSSNCMHCKEAAFKLDAARKKAKEFPEIRIVSYNYKMNDFFKEKKLNFTIDSISSIQFMDLTNGSFPKFALVQNNVVLKKYDPVFFNYAVLDNLSKKLN